VQEGIKLKWQGREIESGPLTITLGEPGSCGVIDYAAEKVNVEFRVHIIFPELSEILDDMGADPAITAPVNAVIRSQGAVFDDHSLRLSGKGEISEHKLFDPAETRISIRAPTQCKPDLNTQSGEEIRAALFDGQPVTWNFNPEEKRVDLTLPESLGGETQVLCLSGSYTFTIAPEETTLGGRPAV